MEKKGKELAQFLIAAVYNRFNIIFKIHFGMISKIHYIYYLFSLFRPAILTNFVEIIRLPISGCTIPEKTSCSVYGWGYTGCKKLFLKTKWIHWELTSSCHYRWGCWYCLMPRLSNSFCYKMQFQFFLIFWIFEHFI